MTRPCDGLNLVQPPPACVQGASTQPHWVASNYTAPGPSDDKLSAERSNGLLKGLAGLMFCLEIVLFCCRENSPTLFDFLASFYSTTRIPLLFCS